MKTHVANELQAYVMDMRTTLGTLWHAEDDRIRCVACGHRCLIGEGKRGICKVRYNQDGQLRVPFGYVAALQCDPVEKKPFFHVYPSSDALTFGMLGCDLHCPYCLAPGARIATSEGMIPIEELFAAGQTIRQVGNEEVRVPSRPVEVYTHTGQACRVRKLFRHGYRGTMVRVRAAYLPPVECTPEHEFLVLDAPPTSGSGQPHFVRAELLKPAQLLAIPKRFDLTDAIAIDTADLLRPFVKPFHAHHRIGPEVLTEILELSAAGASSREIGSRVGKEASHVRHLRSKVRRGVWTLERLEEIDAPLVVEADRVRLPKEHRPGIPSTLILNSRLAKLLGYYCAEGCVVRSKGRVHSATLNFSFGHHEEGLANEVMMLLDEVFGVHASMVRRTTTIGVAVGKASIALCFEALCGHGARSKHVPPALYQAPRDVVESFLRAYVAGDGSTRANGLTQIITVSGELAYGIAWLVLRLGMVPSLSWHKLGNRPIQGRAVNGAPHQFAVNWYFENSLRKYVHHDDDYWYVRIRALECFEYDGDVFNLEVEGVHSYLANLIATHNCQNWNTSQALRDAQATGQMQLVTPAQLVGYAQREHARLVVSSYNEPLITAEWAVAVFAQARAAGLLCAFVSNGNATPEVLDYLRPWIQAYKIDLKSFDDKHYRSLGGKLDSITESIRMVHERGIWLEVVTLVIPGFNDRPEELREAARFLKSVSPDIPWHLTGFHKDYKMTDPPDTQSDELIRAAEIGVEEGLRFVYAGNRPGQVGAWENTRCPSCQETLIERYGYLIQSYHLNADGTCPRCRTRLPGLWPAGAAEVRTGNTVAAYRQRLPRAVR